MDIEQLRHKLVKLVHAHNPGDGSHDISHFNRVWRNALAIAEDYPEADREVLVASAYLHDIDFTPKTHPDAKDSSKIAAAIAGRLLADMRGFPPEKIPAVAHCIEAHSFSAGIEPRTIEAKIIQDADRLDATGAISIARTFNSCGRMGAKLYCEEDLLAKDRALADLKYAFDLFFTRLLKVGDMMHTAKARKMAKKRTKFVQQFADQLLDEVGPGAD